MSISHIHCNESKRSKDDGKYCGQWFAMRGEMEYRILSWVAPTTFGVSGSTNGLTGITFYHTLTTRKLSLTRMSIPDSIRPMTPNNISIRQSNCFLSLQNADRVDVLKPQQTSDHLIGTIIPRQQKNGETSAGIEIYVVRCRTTRRPII